MQELGREIGATEKRLFIGKAPDIARQHMDLGLCQFTGLARHLVNFTLVDHGENRVFAIAVQPGVVAQIGAPNAWLPLPSAPWQAAQTVNLDLPSAERNESCGLPDKLST